jgi:GST-like protein
MIELYYFPTPNTWKASIMLEECGLRYTVKPVNLFAKEQTNPEFLKINPNGKLPAIVDTDGPKGSRIAVFESGAILVYLAEKSEKFLPSIGDPARYEVLQWLFWQVGGLGPMVGQAHTFLNAPEKIPFAIERYTSETARLYQVLNGHLAGREFIAGSYSIADISCYGWIWFHNMHGQDLAVLPHLSAWFDRMSKRDAVRRGRELVLDLLPEGNGDRMRAKEWPKMQDGEWSHPKEDVKK